MSESLLGVSVADTRQKAGAFVNAAAAAVAAAPRPVPDGGANAPAATFCVLSILACGRASVARLSHDPEAAAAASSSVELETREPRDPAMSAAIANADTSLMVPPGKSASR
jgi:hypothetical protein